MNWIVFVWFLLKSEKDFWLKSLIGVNEDYMSSEVIEFFVKFVCFMVNCCKFYFFLNILLVCKYIIKDCFVNDYLLEWVYVV